MNAPPTRPEILGTLGHLHELLREVVRALPETDVNRPLHATLGGVGWQLADAVYRETYWLREVVSGDAELTARVRHLFDDPVGDQAPECASLPPPGHLLAWASEIQDEHLRRLATPGALPDHPLLADDRLVWFLTQEAAQTYERMIALLRLRGLENTPRSEGITPTLTACRPRNDQVEVVQGHYRIGSRHEPLAYDNELPPQAVELASFRIARHPVGNAEYLAFIEAGGYREPAFWDADGRAWLAEQASPPEAPLGWQRDARGSWYEIGLNGPCALVPDQPVCGVNRHEARAYTDWAASLGGAQSGAVLQHEYQWEVAARGGMLEGTGHAREWCSNPFHSYPDFRPFPDRRTSEGGFTHGHGVLRGASLHTLGCLRRASSRFGIRPDARELCSGLRLVYPPD